MTSTQAPRRTNTAFERFVASNGGRAARMALGLGFIAVGLGVVQGTVGAGLAAFGLVPIATGVFNLCPVAPLWGGHFLGSGYCRSQREKA